jgi:hypothetical protein
MPLPLVPLLFVAGAAAIGVNDQGHVPGAVSAPDAQRPDTPATKPTYSPPPPYVPPGPAQPRAGGDPAPADPAVQVVEAGVGTVAGEVKTAVVGAAAVAGVSVLAGGGVGGAAGAAAASLGSAASAAGGALSSAASAAAGTVQVIGPAIGAVGAAAGIVLGAVDIFGGDPINFNALLGQNSAGLSDADYATYKAMVAAGGTQAGDAFLLKVENRLGTKQIEVVGSPLPVAVGRQADLAAPSMSQLDPDIVPEAAVAGALGRRAPLVPKAAKSTTFTVSRAL